MRTTVSTKGQIVLPAKLRKLDRIVPGDEFKIERLEDGVYRLKRTNRRRNVGFVRLLLRCPSKGWFERPERRESTDDIEVPRIG